MAADDICCLTTFMPLGIVLLFFGMPLLASIVRVVMAYENGVVFRLGRLEGLRKPGINLLIPLIDSMRTVDLRIQALDIPKQETLSKDNISVFLNAVVYYRITDPLAAITKVQDYRLAIFQHGQAAMRDIAGSVELDTLLSDRDHISREIREVIARETSEWGIEIISINIQDIELPADMKKAMARQAQAERDKRATILISMGEVEASETLQKAARIISASPGALHLRTLQALSTLSADKTNTITYLLPIEGQSLPDGEMDEPEVKVGKKK